MAPGGERGEVSGSDSGASTCGDISAQENALSSSLLAWLLSVAERVSRSWAVSRVLIPSLLIVGLLACGPTEAVGQSFSIEGLGALTLWPHSDRCYQNGLSAGVQAQAKGGPGFAEGSFRVKWWGGCDSKFGGSLVKPEVGRSFERWYRINAGLEIHGVQLGVSFRRDAVQHFWRERIDSPWEGGAEEVRRRCRNGDACPSIGYYEGISGYLGLELLGFDVSVTTPPYRWEKQTLPWPGWTLEASYVWSQWRLGVTGQAGGLQEPTIEGRFYSKLSSRLWLGIRAGTLSSPDWHGPINRVAVSLELW